MEVTKTSFYPLLLDILTDISESHFVALDLELSGVPSKGLRHGDARGRPSLQQRYVETKEAAERYQILQIGLTCVTENVENGKYVCKPYNFELSPVVDTSGLDVERIFSYQSGAAEFLLRVGFDMAKPFTIGVPYLSRAETKEARAKFAKRQDKNAIADMQIKPTDTEALALLDRVRNEISTWLTGPASASQDYINIGPTSASGEIITDAGPPGELSRFEKRLVHQLVRAEYPELITISKRGFIQIVRFDKEREDRIAADRKAESDAKIAQQKGFRWIIEALLGSNISGLDLKLCASDAVTGEAIFADLQEYNAQFNRAQALMRGCPRVLVGHNCFLDLVYVYRTFIGELPETVVEFQTKLHKLWPTIIDTKYMATHNCGDINPMSSLEQIAKQLEEYQLAQGKQLDTLDELHTKYKDVEVFHEAGFDSFLTAQVAVRLSSKLEKEDAYVEVLDDKAVSDDEKAGQGGVQLGQPDATGVGQVVEKTKGLISAAMNMLSPNGADSESANRHTNGTANLSTNDNHDQAPVNLMDEDTGSTASSPSKLSAQANSFVPSAVGGKWKRRGDPTVPAINSSNDPFEYKPGDLKHRHKITELETKGIEGGMPRFGTDFWRVYGNKLRVFGTEEGVCVLKGGETDEMDDKA